MVRNKREIFIREIRRGIPLQSLRRRILIFRLSVSINFTTSNHRYSVLEKSLSTSIAWALLLREIRRLFQREKRDKYSVKLKSKSCISKQIYICFSFAEIMFRSLYNLYIAIIKSHKITTVEYIKLFWMIHFNHLHRFNNASLQHFELFCKI